MTESDSSHGEGAADSPDSRAPGGQLRAIIESLADGILIVDRHGVIRFANPAAERLFNRQAEQLIGTILGLPLVAGETTEMEIVRRGGGDMVHAELRVVATEWDGETVELVSLREITDRKHAEERARQLSHEREARLAAEAASRAKSDFLAIMSHELRTPLNAILGYSELMEMGLSGHVPDKIREHISRVQGSGRHLLSLVNDILDIAKVEVGSLWVANARASIAPALKSAIELVQPQADARQLELVVMPGADALPPYVGDEERVCQILVNLLSNAVKCTEPGGSITVEASVEAAPSGGARLPPRTPAMRISVADTGAGIPADKLASIFEPFVQVDTGLTRKQEGSGLGLTIAGRLARAMGGDLTVESKVGTGSTFTLWMPTGIPATERSDGGQEGEPDPEGTPRRIVNAKEPSWQGLSDVARAILSQVSAIESAIVGRIRSDPSLTMAAGLRSSQVADHLATLLADIAATLVIMEEIGGTHSPLLSDAKEIQRLISELHGTQRGRIGWTEASVRREFMIIREELERVVRGAVPLGGTLLIEDAIAAVNQLLDQSEYVSVRALATWNQSGSPT